MFSLSHAGISVLLGLIAAITWGAADFAGGFATRRAAPSYVVLLAHGTSLLLLAAAALALPATPVVLRTIVKGLLSGVTGGVALMLFYEALALGVMGLSASVAGLLTAALPTLLALRSEGAPAPPQLCGFAVAAASIVLIASAPGGGPEIASGPFKLGADDGDSYAPDEPSARCAAASQAGAGLTSAGLRGLSAGAYRPAIYLRISHGIRAHRPMVFAVLAGVGFGMQLVLLHAAAMPLPGAAPQARQGSAALAPLLRALLLSRLGGAAATLAVLLWSRARRRVGVSSPPSSLSAKPRLPAPRLAAPVALAGLAALAGLLDTAGNGFYMLSSLSGRLDVAAVLASLYPGATIALAALVLHERATRLQALGMGLALVAVGLIAG